MDIQTLLAIEKGFWFEGTDYYHKHLSAPAMFVFPNMRLSKEGGVVEVGKGLRWDNLEITDEHLLRVTDEVLLLTYYATAIREGQPPYKGYITSVYRREHGSPKMIFHQHTPDTI